MNQSQVTDAMILKALDADIGTLYAVIGHSVELRTLGIAPTDRATLVASGERWLRGHLDALQSRVCGNATLQGVAIRPDADTSDNVNAVAAVIDTIVSLCNGVPVVSVATLVLKVGLREFCRRDGGGK